MTARKKLAANEQREELFVAAEWRSVVSGEPLRMGVPQLAHRVAKTKNRINTYGEEVMNHPLNLVPVRDLAENDRVNIGNRPVEANALLQRIIRVVTGVEPMPSMKDEYRTLREAFEERDDDRT